MATQLVSSPTDPSRSAHRDHPRTTSSIPADPIERDAPSLILIDDTAKAVKPSRAARIPVYSRGERDLRAGPTINTEGLGSEPLKSDAAHHIETGLEYFRKGLAYEAISLYREAISEEPDSALAYYLLGITLKLLKQEDEARSAWTAAIETGEPGNEAQWARERAALLLSRVD